MKKLMGLVLFCALSSSAFAAGQYTSANGHFVVQDVSVDDQSFFQSVTLKLDLANGTFSIVDVQETAPEQVEPEGDTAGFLGESVLEQVDSEGYTVGFLGCEGAGEIASFNLVEKQVVTCEIQITNHQADRFIRVFGNHSSFGTKIKDDLSVRGLVLDIFSGDNEGDNILDIFLPRSETINIRYKIWLNVQASSIAFFSPSLKDIETSTSLDVEFEGIEFKRADPEGDEVTPEQAEPEGDETAPEQVESEGDETAPEQIEPEGDTVGFLGESVLEQVDSEGYTVGFLGCEGTGEIASFGSVDKQVVICEIQMTNHQADRFVRVFGNHRFLGTEIKDDLSISGLVLDIFSGANEGDNILEVFLPQNETINIRYKIWLNIQASSIASFSPSLRDIETSTSLEVEFKNIEFKINDLE